MNLVVLGASSMIGSEIALQFASGNNLLLVGRNGSKLEEAAGLCRANGSARVQILEGDLHANASEISQAANSWDVDVILNAACSTSRLRDDDIKVEELEKHVTVDLLAPIQLIGSIARQNRHKKIRVVFVSSLLAIVRSPRRLVYGSLKSMHELLLSKLVKAEPGLRLLIVRVAVSVPPDQRSEVASALARAVRRAFDDGRTELFFGKKGRVLCWLYYAQPLIFNTVVEMSRRFRPPVPSPDGSSQGSSARKQKELKDSTD